MAKTWTPERDHKLLLLLLDQINFSGGVAATAAANWKTNYVDTGKDTYQPTARAISEHIATLKNSVHGKAKSSPGTPRAQATPRSTPRKSAAVKTPKSGTKRKRTTKSSDDEDEVPDEEEDTDAERAMLKAPTPGSRSSLSRRSKSVANSKKYQESGDEESTDELTRGGEAARSATPTPTAGAEMQQDFFAGGAFDGVDEADQRAGQMVGVMINAVRDINEAARVGRGRKMGSVVANAGEGVVASALTPQGKTGSGGKQATSATKRVVKRKTFGDDVSDGSEFSPEF